jgi:aldehyde dehydrogenase (NAD+)
MAYKHTGPTKLCINNEWVNSVSGKTFPTVNPATGEVVAQVAEADKADVDKAVVAARKAFQTWRLKDSAERSAILHKVANVMESRAEEYYAMEIADNGKPLNHVKGDLAFTVSFIRYFAGLADKLYGMTLPVDGDQFAMTIHEPIGVVGAIIPWNFPILMWVWKFAPAIACGNTLVLKPAEQTPLTALWAQQCCIDAGLPPGVLNTLPGYGPTCGAAISGHMDIDKIAFTGSGETGRIIQAAAAKSNLKQVTLELGGKSPLIIFPDADLDAAAAVADLGLFFNMGQCCCASSRIYCHESVYDAFVKKCTELAQKRKIGDPNDITTEHGAQIDQEQFDKIMKYIDTGKKQGANLKCGGGRHGDKGFFVQPTVFADVKDDMAIAQEEIFGPVMSILKWKDVGDVIRRANNTRYGLAAGLITKDIGTALSVAQCLRAGTIWINCWDAFHSAVPFGGFKESGYGRDCGVYATRAYTQVKAINIRVPKIKEPIEIQGM